MTKKKSINWKKEAMQWGGLLSIVVLLYVTGWHTQVSGKLQQAILWTGIIRADTELPEAEQIQINYIMPLVTLDGEPANLSAYKGKVVFLNFWATWCPPCIAEMPNIQSLYEKFGNNEDMVFLMINLDDDIQKARDYLNSNNYTFGSYKILGSRPPAFQSTVIPTTFVISKEGRLVAKKRGMANYNTTAFRDFIGSLLDN